MEAGQPICEQCKKPFKPKRSWQRFCCTKCHDLWWTALRKEALERFLEREELHLIEEKEAAWSMAETS